jgi:hypothetical protein
MDMSPLIPCATWSSPGGRCKAVFAEAADARVHEPRIDLAHALVIDAQPVLDARPVVFDQHVGLLDQTLEYRNPLGAFEVERDAAPVALEVLKIGAMTLVERTAVAVLLAGLLDLDDVRAPVSELPRSRRSRAARVRSSTVKRASGPLRSFLPWRGLLRRMRGSGDFATTAQSARRSTGNARSGRVDHDSPERRMLEMLVAAQITPLARGSSPSFTLPMRTRFKPRTVRPTSSHMRRICRFCPRAG